MAQFTGHRFFIGGFVVLKLFACQEAAKHF